MEVYMGTFEIVILVIVVLAIYLYAKSKFDEKELLRSYARKNEKEWGAIPDRNYTNEMFQAIKQYYLANKGKQDIDDITWNDLNMDIMFMLMNNTHSSMGEDYLYGMLRKIEVEEKELHKREHIISFFQKNKEARNTLQTEFRFMGKIEKFSLYQYINTTEKIPAHSPIASIFMASMLVLSVILIGLSLFEIVPAIYGIILFVFTLINNITHYFNRKTQIEKYFNVLMYIIRMLNGAKELEKKEIPEIKEYLERIKEINGMFGDFKRGSFLVFFDSKRGQGSSWDLVLDYVRIMFHLDLIKFDTMVKKVQACRNELNELYEILGFLDASLAIASFRTWLSEDGYCIPSLEKTSKPYIHMDMGYHAMLEHPVANSIHADKCVLITGSNASGKSTFIKTVAINAILAQTINTAIAKSYKASYFKVFSSMALRDDIQGNESYYIVEIKSLKRILDQLEADIPTLCFVDEVLRGTNTLERIAASAQILHNFANTNTICFAATHDLELTHILEDYYENYHFQEEVVEDEVVFDYVLNKGRAVSRNAIKLLGIMGYDKEIIEKAEDLANTFLKEGIWERV